MQASQESQLSMRMECVNGWEGEYEGQVVDGIPHGQGTFKDDTHDGNEYEGYFQDGLFHGRGLATYDHLDTYDGEWQEGKYHGYGTRSYECGVVSYEGQWKADQRHGFGIFSPGKGKTQCGKWENDKFIEPMARVDVLAVIRSASSRADTKLKDRVASYDSGLLAALKSPKYAATSMRSGYGENSPQAAMERRLSHGSINQIITTLA